MSNFLFIHNILKYRCHNLARPLLIFWSLWTAFISWCSLSWRYFCFTLVVVDPCFIYCHKPIQKIILPRLNGSKQRSEFLTCCCLWSGVGKRGTHFEKNLRIPKDSCKIVNTLPSDIFKVSAILRNFNLRSPKTISWTFVMFSGTTADFWRPERKAPWVFVQPRLNSPYPLMIVDFPPAEFP